MTDTPKPPQEANAVLHVIRHVTDCVNDPMWADHAEVSKVLLRNVLTYLRDHPSLAQPPQAAQPEAQELPALPEASFVGWAAYTGNEIHAYARAALAQERERNPWRTAVQDACITIEYLSEDPRESIKRLLDVTSQIALDPAVSSDAQALIERGAAQERERNEAAEKDAARYRWMRDVGWATGMVEVMCVRYGPEEWDEKIDNQIAAVLKADSQQERPE